MDSRLGVQHGHHHSHNKGISKPPVHHHHAGRRGGGAGSGTRQGGGGGNKGIKVVYISSPMKLTASAEEFRAIVQELTGRDSNVADHDLDGGGAYYAGAPSSSSSYSSFGRVSPAATAAGARALSPPTMVAATKAGPVRRAPPEYAAAMAEPPPFQNMYDQTAGSLLYGQDYW